MTAVILTSLLQVDEKAACSMLWKIRPNNTIWLPRIQCWYKLCTAGNAHYVIAFSIFISSNYHTPFISKAQRGRVNCLLAESGTKQDWFLQSRTKCLQRLCRSLVTLIKNISSSSFSSNKQQTYSSTRAFTGNFTRRNSVQIPLCHSFYKKQKAGRAASFLNYCSADAIRTFDQIN
jgi:hypothetical protein